MIDISIFSKEYIDKKRKELKCDPTILERTIFAFGLLEAMVKSGAEFIFKGGSCLLLILNKALRLSTDIDIIAKPGTDILKFVLEASKTYPFVRYEENIRKGANSIEKKHFRFFYKSLINESKEIPILLDVLFEENHYSKIWQKEIKNEIVITKGKPIYVNIPSPESLLGDKLTAFAPKTIGVRPLVEKSDGKIIDKKVEVIKQFFDVALLYDLVDNFNDVIISYNKTAESELKYRGLEISIKDCLMDTFKAAASIMCRGKIDSEAYKDYLEGIKGLGNFLVNTRFNAETAYIPAAKVMYLSACVIKGLSPINVIPEQELLKGEYSKLNYLRKLDKKHFNMAAYAVRILEAE